LSLGPPELHRIGGCHARPSLRAPHAFGDDTRTSCLVRRCRYSHVEGRHLLAHLGSVAASRLPRGPVVVVACPHRGPSSLALWIGEPPPPHHRSGNRLRYSESRNLTAATATTGRGSAAARALGQPPLSHAPSLMNRGGT
jgi:hypothetical protein